MQDFKLLGEVVRWWKAKKQLLAMELGGVPIIWDQFKKEFNDQFFPRAQQL
jgi:hypothetical protein